MTDRPDQVVWERTVGHELLRFSIRSYQGRGFAELRRWYRNGDQWRHGAKGCTVPLDALWELTAALMMHHGLAVPDRPDSGC